MVCFGKNIIKFVRALLNLTKLPSTKTCSSIAARPGLEVGVEKQNSNKGSKRMCMLQRGGVLRVLDWTARPSRRI